MSTLETDRLCMENMVECSPPPLFQVTFQTSVSNLDIEKSHLVLASKRSSVNRSLVLAVKVMENLAFLANASNLVTYLTGFMHFSLSDSAVTDNNFMATIFLLAILGVFFFDAFSITYVIYLVSAFIEFLGLVILTIQARSTSLKRPPCTSSSTTCESMTSSQAAMMFAGMYLSALGIGGIKGSLAPHSA